MDATVTNAYGVRMCTSIGDKVNGKFKCVSSLVNPKEFKLNTLKRAAKSIPLSMSDLTGGVPDPHENKKAAKEHEVTLNPHATDKKEHFC